MLSRVSIFVRSEYVARIKDLIVEPVINNVLPDNRPVDHSRGRLLGWIGQGIAVNINVQFNRDFLTSGNNRYGLLFPLAFDPDKPAQGID